MATHDDTTLSLSPDAIRNWFESDEEIEPLLAKMDDEDLRNVGFAVLQNDELTEVLHTLLCDAIRNEARHL